MAQASIRTASYAQPYTPIKIDGDKYSVPDGLVDGLRFLKRFLRRVGGVAENEIHLVENKLFALTNNLIVDYEIGQSDLSYMSFYPEIVQPLEAFETPPDFVTNDGNKLNFQWSDGQELYFKKAVQRRDIRDQARNAFDRFWSFNTGVRIEDETRKTVLKRHAGPLPSHDVFIDGSEIASRVSSDRKTWTSQEFTPFDSNTDRLMRFERKAFLDMLRVADEIDFSCSPVCFLHAHGRGMLVERTIGSDIPEFDA